MRLSMELSETSWPRVLPWNGAEIIEAVALPTAHDFDGDLNAVLRRPSPDDPVRPSDPLDWETDLEPLVGMEPADKEEQREQRAGQTASRLVHQRARHRESHRTRDRGRLGDIAGRPRCPDTRGVFGRSASVAPGLRDSVARRRAADATGVGAKTRNSGATVQRGQGSPRC